MKKLNKSQIASISGGFKCTCTIEVKYEPPLKNGYIPTIETGLETDNECMKFCCDILKPLSANGSPNGWTNINLDENGEYKTTIEICA